MLGLDAGGLKAMAFGPELGAELGEVARRFFFPYLQITVGTAGPQPPAPNHSGQYRTSTYNTQPHNINTDTYSAHYTTNKAQPQHTNTKQNHKHDHKHKTKSTATTTTTHTITNT